MSMNIRKRYPDKGRTPESMADVARIIAMWSDCRARYGKEGPYLFGKFSIADAMYAPVVLRFRTYAVELPPDCRAYADAILALPATQDWIAAAEAETESLPQFELYG
jgi:glutathione S-transferase